MFPSDLASKRRIPVPAGRLQWEVPSDRVAAHPFTGIRFKLKEKLLSDPLVTAPGSLVERLGVMPFRVEPDGVMRAPSAALRRLLGASRSRPVRLAELMPAGYWDAAREGLREDGYWTHPALELSLSNGEQIQVALALEGGDGDEPGFSGVLQEIRAGGAPRPLEAVVRMELLHERLERIIGDRRGPDRAGYAVLLLGLDRFRVVNDGLGHRSANALLAQVARRLEGCIRSTDTLARSGVDEFVLLLQGIEAGEDAVRAARCVQRALEAPFELDGREIVVTASIGLTLGRAGDGTSEDVLRQAAIALGRAKARGGGFLQLFGSEMRDEAVAALELEIDLRRGLETGELRVAYQPLISLSDRKLMGFEALVRWRNSAGEEIGPDDFVPLAEETGLIVALDRWVLFEATSRLAAWRTIPGCEHLCMSVNLSSRGLLHPDLVEEVTRSLEISGLEPSALRLEITESAVMENPAAAARVLAEIRALGVKLQLDDFGTGHSSLGQLPRLPLDAVKIDRSFVRGMHEERGALFIETIVVLAQHLGLSVVAEGIENEDQLHGVHAIGCEYAQGFLISRPLETEGVRALLLDNEAPLLDAGAPVHWLLREPHLVDLP